MKALLWITLPLLLLMAFFTLSETSDRSETKSEPSAPQAEESAPAAAEAVSLSIFPHTVLQGEPVRIAIGGLASADPIRSLTVDDEPLPIFVDKDELAALVGIGFHKKPGAYPVVLTLADGRIIEEKIAVERRAVATSDFDIPTGLGGNTPQAEHALTASLAEDTAVIQDIIATTGPEKLWNGEFRLPLDEPVTVTDTYGYNRQTGSVNLSHQGTDFRAAEGTSVYAMNRGIVAFAGTFRNYGHTVIIDHGLGLMTFSMHLSEIKVLQDQSVEKGDLIALSGNTGYSLGPHLHLSVRIDGLTIDPMKFLELMGTR